MVGEPYHFSHGGMKSDDSKSYWICSHDNWYSYWIVLFF